MKKILIAFALLLAAACTPSWQPEGEERLVVEGWIDAGGFPIVMVTTSVPTSTEYQSIDDQESHLMRHARVTVSDGENSVILTGKYNDAYFPPYIYTTSDLRGVAGKSYSLKVELPSVGLTAIGTTTIPTAVPLDSIWCVPSPDDKGKYNIKARFSDPEASEDYYRLFVKVAGKDSSYVASYMGCMSDSDLPRHAEINVMRGLSVDNESSWAWNPASFEKGDEVMVKFCTMDRVSYEFWNSYERVVSLSVLPMFQATYNPAFNVTGGIGYWCGYGASKYTIRVGE